MVKIRKYFGLGDVLNMIKSGVYAINIVSSQSSITALNDFISNLSALYITGRFNTPYAPIKATTFDITYFKDVLNAIISKYANDGYATTWVDFYPHEEEPTSPYTIQKTSLPGSQTVTITSISDEALKFLGRFCAIYNETQEKYLTLMGYYASQKSHLLDKIQNITISRYNDTPQEGGDWSDDEFTSNITRNESNSDVLPLMDKLTTVQNNYRDLVRDWANEFKGLFFIVPEDAINE